MEKEKIYTQTAYHYEVIPAGVLMELVNGKLEKNKEFRSSVVKGRIVEQDVLDVQKSKAQEKHIYRKGIFIEIVVENQNVKDVVAHELIENDPESNKLKKRFKDAWAEFEKNRNVIVYDNGRIKSESGADDDTELTEELKKNRAELKSAKDALETADEINKSVSAELEAARKRIAELEKAAKK